MLRGRGICGGVCARPRPGPVGGRGGCAAAQYLCPHRPRDTSVTCMKTSAMATTSSPCWRCSRGTAWCVCPPTCPLWGPACLSPGHPRLPSCTGAFPTRPLRVQPGLGPWSAGPSLGVAPTPVRGLPTLLLFVSGPDPVTSPSALLWFLCCLDCEPWPLPFTLCPALAGQPRERDVIRSSRLVSGCACWLRQRVGSPRPGAQLTWGWWPVWLGPCLALGQVAGCLMSCLLQCPGLGLGPSGAATPSRRTPPPVPLPSTRGFLAPVPSHPFLPPYSLSLAAGLPKPLLGLAPGPAASLLWLGRVRGTGGMGRAAARLGEDPQSG